jgi:hypothetical protein
MASSPEERTHGEVDEPGKRLEVKAVHLLTLAFKRV